MKIAEHMLLQKLAKFTLESALLREEFRGTAEFSIHKPPAQFSLKARTENGSPGE